MKLAVCIKQVPSSSEVSVDPVTHNLIREKSGTMMNPSDLNALEMALGIKEENQGVCETAAITMGPPGAQEELRTAMAMGIDRGCLLTDRCLAGGDTIATARALAKGLSRLGTYDLILAGAESSDGATGQVGPMLAEAMGLPHVSSVPVSYTHLLEIVQLLTEQKRKLNHPLEIIVFADEEGIRFGNGMFGSSAFCKASLSELDGQERDIYGMTLSLIHILM